MENETQPDATQDDFSGIAAAVVTDPPEAQIIDDENDGWEDPPLPPAAEPEQDAGEPADPIVTDSPDDPPADDEPRRPRGWLESDIERLIKRIQSGEVFVDAPLTPHKLAKKLAEVESLPKEPSTGAVSAVFDRWVKVGAAVMSEKPYAFVEFTDAAKGQGIAALKAAVAAERSADKKAAKAAADAKAGAEAAA